MLFSHLKSIYFFPQFMYNTSGLERTRIESNKLNEFRIKYCSMMGKIMIFTVLMFVTFGILTDACDMDQTQFGCRIINAQCNCGYGCRSEFRYDSMGDCTLALKGGRSDMCDKPNPCFHHGICLQISQSPGFKCRCEGTRYHGPLCDRPCPEPSSFSNSIPWECVVI